MNTTTEDKKPADTPAKENTKLPDLAEIQDRPHSPHSPSSLNTKSKCCGFKNDEARDKSAAQRGELGHRAVELENTEILGDDEELAAAASACIDFKKSRIREWPGARVLQEERLDMLNGQWGYLDVQIVDQENKRVRILDWKFAFSQYFADSPQFWAYALGIWDKYPWAEEVHVDVVMPFRDEIDTEVFSRKTCYDKFTSLCSGIIAKAETANPDTFCTGYWCEWCGRDCPVRNTLAVQVAEKYSGIAVPEETHSSKITDPVEMAKLLQVADILAGWVSSVKKHATDLALQGYEIPGRKLTTRKGQKTVANPQVVYSLIQEEVSINDFLRKVNISYKDLEEVFVESVPKGMKGKKKLELEDRLRDAGILMEGAGCSYLSKSRA